MVILGGGESGVGAALLAKQQGYDTFLSDGSSLKENYRNELQQAGIGFEEGQHDVERILAADEVVKSPGIPEKKVFQSSARSNWLTVSKATAKSSLSPGVTERLPLQH
jgi:UDP-N-acetylmuramoylalanine--D-glutamate ligase